MNGIVSNYKEIRGLEEYVYGKYVIHTYEWTCGNTDFSLVYDNDGELYGIISDGIPQDVLDDIVEEPLSNCVLEGNICYLKVIGNKFDRNEKEV